MRSAPGRSVDSSRNILFRSHGRVTVAVAEAVEETLKDKKMEPIYYRVLDIDGDYAHLQNTDAPSAEPKLVARALLPEEIQPGSLLKCVFLEYELVTE